MNTRFLFFILFSLFFSPVGAQNIIDEVVWVVGDEAILKSDIEQMRLQAAQEGLRFNGDPDCAIPEQIAVQKLFLHQAAIDSIEVSESDIASGIDRQIDSWIEMAGSREKLEEYKRRHDGLIAARGDAVSEGPDSNFTIWCGAGYIFGYCEKVKAYNHEMTEGERREIINWETRQLEIMDWLTDDVDWITGQKHPHIRRIV